MRSLAVCGFFRGETPYLREWIEYHRLVGADHFYMLNNDPDPAPAEAVLARYPDGLVTHLPWPGGPAVAQQMLGYQHVLALSAGRCRWVAFIDLDEFIVPLDGDSVPAILDSLPDCGGVGMNQRVFGTSGHDTPQQIQIDAYRRCAEPDFPSHGDVKCAVRPDRVVKVLSPHHFRYRRPHYAVGEDGRPYPHIRRTPTWERLRINHYTTRSREECLAKMAKWAAADNPALHDRHLQKFDRNEDEDHVICRFLPALLPILAGG